MTNIAFPNICAWCGSQSVSSTRKVNYSLDHSEGAFSFQIPICKECDHVVGAMVRKERLTRIFTGIFSFALVNIASLLLSQGKPYETERLISGLGFGLSLVVGILGAINIANVFIKNDLGPKIQNRKPYEFIWRIHPATLVIDMLSQKELSFHHEQYNREFQSLNQAGIKIILSGDSKYKRTPISTIIGIVEIVIQIVALGALAIIFFPVAISGALAFGAKRLMERYTGANGCMVWAVFMLVYFLAIAIFLPLTI